MISIELLKEDLLQLEPEDFFMKHIVKSYNWYFSEYLNFPDKEVVDRLDYFNEIISKNMGISFHSSQIVGSAKTGFSLSPQKMLKPFHEQDNGHPSSDIDIAIISNEWYEKLWNKLRKIYGIQYQAYYRYLTAAIFRGYINDSNLLNVDPLREEWIECVSPINIKLQDELSFMHPIKYRIYRSWEDLQEYQIIGIRKTKKALEG